MQNTPLTTKFYGPASPNGYVVRERLHDRLRAGLSGKLTLVSAPAGFGKTALVANWLIHAERPFAWLTLDENDNDFVRFFRSLVAALRRVEPSLGQALLTRFDAPQLPPVETLLTPLVDEFANVLIPYILVLDDYHQISNRHIHETLAFLLENAPAQFHLVMLTRVDPPIALSQLRVQRALTELRTSDLRFNQQEAMAFFTQKMELPLTVEQVAVVTERVEGWGAGLLLAALALRDRRDVEQWIDSFHGSPRPISDDLSEEVLRRQPKIVQSFLVKTAILDQLCAPLCDSILGSDLPQKARDSRLPNVAGSQDVLEYLERTKLFLVPLDDDRRWYRYQHVFAAFLRAQLTGLDGNALHNKAAQWYSDNGHLPQAIRHALAEGDAALAGRFILAGVDQAIKDGEVANLCKWLDALPDTFVRTQDALAVAKGWALFMMWQLEAAESYAASARAIFSPDTLAATRGRLAGLQARLAFARGDLDTASNYSIAALEIMGDADLPLRIGALLVFGEVQKRVGQLQDATKAYREARDLSRDIQAVSAFVRAMDGLAQLEHIMGRRREAIAICQEAFQVCVDSWGNSLPIAGVLEITLGNLFFEGNCLTTAREHMIRGLESCQPTDATSMFVGKLSLAKLQQAMGEEIGALLTLQEARQMARVHGPMLDENDLAMVEAGIYLQQGNTAAAYDWAEEVREKISGPARTVDALLFARLLLSQQNPTEADALLEGVVRQTNHTGHVRELITALILRALAHQTLGYSQGARSFLEEALHLAAPEGYFRAFLDEWSLPGIGHPLRELLREMRGTAPEFVTDLLQNNP